MKPILTQLSPEICELKWSENPSDHLLQILLNYENKIKEDFAKDSLEVRLGFNSIVLRSNTILPFQELSNWINSFPSKFNLIPLPEKTWKLPACYSISTGRDLLSLSSSKGISIEELIHLHTEPSYRIHFYGFLPGFMYLNGLSEKLITPRKHTPDRQVPAGSIAIGGSQTGIYPCSSPGGWHLIGSSPTQFFDKTSNVPVFANPGERVSFYPITEGELDKIVRHPLKFDKDNE